MALEVPVFDLKGKAGNRAKKVPVFEEPNCFFLNAPAHIGNYHEVSGIDGGPVFQSKNFSKIIDCFVFY